jgi:hypothetical protein
VISRSPLRFVIRFAVICTILCATLVVLAGISAVAVRTSKAVPIDNVSTSASDAAEAHPASRFWKSSKLSQLLATTIKAPEHSALEQTSSPPAEQEHFYRAVTVAMPMSPSSELDLRDNAPQPRPTIDLMVPETPVSAPQPQAPMPSKPKPQPPAVTPAAAPNVLDDGQIAGLKSRLRLTADQAEYWPAVEGALREVARTQMRHGKKQADGKINIDVNSPEVQKLLYAAMPLLSRLRADQKSEVRKLAKIMGLEQVASYI